MAQQGQRSGAGLAGGIQALQPSENKDMRGMTSSKAVASLLSS